MERSPSRVGAAADSQSPSLVRKPPMGDLSLGLQSGHASRIQSPSTTPSSTPTRTGGSIATLKGPEKCLFGPVDSPWQQDPKVSRANNASSKDTQEKQGFKPEPKQEPDGKSSPMRSCVASGIIGKTTSTLPDRSLGGSVPSSSGLTKPFKIPGAVENSDRTSESQGSWSPKLPARALAPAVPPHGVPLSLGKVRQGLGPVNCYRGTLDWDDKVRLEVVEEHSPSPSPSPTAVAPSLCGPSLCRSRPISPGDKTSFVTQLTAVAKNVLGPIKMATAAQEAPKAKETAKLEEKPVGLSGKPEAVIGGRQVGAAVGKAQSSATAQPEKKDTSSSLPK